MGFPFGYLGQRGAAGDTNGEIDGHFHSEIGLRRRLSRVANTPTPELASDSFSSQCLKKSSA